jgi:hypothetical protein
MTCVAALRAEFGMCLPPGTISEVCSSGRQAAMLDFRVDRTWLLFGVFDRLALNVSSWYPGRRR